MAFLCMCIFIFLFFFLSFSFTHFKYIFCLQKFKKTLILPHKCRVGFNGSEFIIKGDIPLIIFDSKDNAFHFQACRYLQKYFPTYVL